MKSKALFPLLITLILLSNCNSKSETTLVQKIGKAHQKEVFLNKRALKMDVNITFNGKTRLNGELILQTNSSEGLLTLKDGNQIYFNQDKVYCSPEIENQNKVRFDAYTWSYFFLFPYKLSDEGTVWSKVESVTMNEQAYNQQKLTFKNGTGDAPDDWYIVYSNPKTNLIRVAAYIVTAGKTKAEAEKNPHAISYENYTIFEEIPIATSWKFWEWNKTEGLTKQIGNATLSNIEFIQSEEQLFKIPTDFIEIK